MSAPKIIAAFVDRDGYARMLGADGAPLVDHRSEADARLARSGQRAIWPEGHGVVVIEDIPKPEPLPTIYYWNDAWTSTALRSAHFGLIATITFDENDVATVVRHDH